MELLTLRKHLILTYKNYHILITTFEKMNEENHIVLRAQKGKKHSSHSRK